MEETDVNLSPTLFFPVKFCIRISYVHHSVDPIHKTCSTAVRSVQDTSQQFFRRSCHTQCGTIIITDKCVTIIIIIITVITIIIIITIPITITILIILKITIEITTIQQ